MEDTELTLERIEDITRWFPGDFVAYWVLEDKMRVLSYSPQILDSFDVTAEEFEAATARDALDVVVESDRAHVFSTVDGKPVGPTEIDCMFRLLHRTQGFFWVHSKSQIIGTYKGGTVCLTNYLNSSDETEVYSNVLNHSNSRIYVTDIDTHEVLYRNEAARDAADLSALDRRPVYKCYEYLHGLTAPCEYCPGLLLEPGETLSKETYVEQTGRWLHSQADLLTWCGHNALIQFVDDITESKQAEKALTESENLYQAATRGANISVFEYDMHRHCIDSPRDGMADFSKPDHIANVPESLLHQFREEDRPRARAFFRQVDEGIPFISDDFWMMMYDGAAPRCMRFTYSNTFDEDGRPLKAYAVSQDITAYKENEEAYDAFLKRLLTSNTESIGSFHMNLTTNTCGSGVSPSVYIMEFQKQGTVDGFFEASGRVIAFEEDLRYYQEHFNRKSLLAAFEKGQTEISHVFRDFLEDGEVHYVNTTITMMRNPRTGDVEGVIYSYDVSAHILHERIIQHITNEEFDFIALLDTTARKLRFQFVNEATEVIKAGMVLDYDIEFLPSSTRYVSINEREAAIEAATIKRITERLDVNGAYSFFFSQPMDNGDLRKQLKYAWFDEEHRNILVVKSDVTRLYLQEQRQRRELESALTDAERANEAKSRFLSNVSHDMRTPLNGIMGYLTLAAEERDLTVVDEYLVKAQKSSEILLQLINDTLDLNKLESGKLSLDPKPISTESLARKIVTAVQPSMDEKKLDFSFEYRGPADMLIMIDVLRVSEVFINLLSNAIKFTPAGGHISLTVECVDVTEDTAAFRSTIEDDGVGMTEGFLEHAYEPFSQERTSETADIGGSGLGLSIVRQIVDLVGGTMEMRSEPGKGTTCIICNTYERVNAGAGERTARPISPDALAGKKILLCEDNAMNREIATAILEAWDAEVDCAVNGLNGVRLFASSETGEYDAILMDIRMPVMDGYMATRKIREMTRHDAQTVPIIAVSADAYADDIERSLAVGMDGHVVKPIDPEKLFAQLVRHLG